MALDTKGISQSICRIGIGSLGLVGMTVAAQADQLNVRMANNTTCNIAAPHIAEQMGIYKDTGVEVNFVSSAASIPAVAFLANGDADLVMLDPNEIYNAATAGQETSLIYEVMQQESASLSIPAESDITSIADLKGKTLGLSSDRDTATAAIALSTADLKIEDVTTVVVGDSGPVVARALRDKQIDAFVGNPEDVAAIDAAGVSLRFITPLLITQSIGNSFAIWDERAEDKREAVTKFLRGFAMANLATQIDPIATASMCAAVLPEEWEDPSVGWAIFNNSIRNLNLKRTKHWGELQPDIWAAYQEPLIQIGTHPAFIEPSEFLNDSFIEGANDFTTAEVKERLKAWRAANPDKLLQ